MISICLQKRLALNDVVNGEFVRFQVAFLPEILIAQIAVELGSFVALEFQVFVHGRHVFVFFLAVFAMKPRSISGRVFGFVIKSA